MKHFIDIHGHHQCLWSSNFHFNASLHLTFVAGTETYCGTDAFVSLRMNSNQRDLQTI